MKDRKTFKILTACSLLCFLPLGRYYIGAPAFGRTITLNGFWFGGLFDLFYMDKTFDEAMARRGFMNTTERNR